MSGDPIQKIRDWSYQGDVHGQLLRDMIFDSEDKDVLEYAKGSYFRMVKDPYSSALVDIKDLFEYRSGLSSHSWGGVEDPYSEGYLKYVEEFLIPSVDEYLGQPIFSRWLCRNSFGLDSSAEVDGAQRLIREDPDGFRESLCRYRKSLRHCFVNPSNQAFFTLDEGVGLWLAQRFSLYNKENLSFYLSMGDTFGVQVRIVRVRGSIEVVICDEELNVRSHGVFGDAYPDVMFSISRALACAVNDFHGKHMMTPVALQDFIANVPQGGAGIWEYLKSNS